MSLSANSKKVLHQHQHQYTVTFGVNSVLNTIDSYAYGQDRQAGRWAPEE